MKRLISLLLLMLLPACNTTPERRLDEALPGQVRPAAAASPSVQASPGGASPVKPADPVVPAVSSPSPAAAAASPSPVASQVPAGILKQGSFRDAVHRVSGRALLIESEGKRFARLEDFTTENGPDLYVYLVRRADGRPQGDADFVSLDRLRGTTGNQNYEIPAGTDLTGVQAITIWCRAFSVNFGYATLP